MKGISVFNYLAAQELPTLNEPFYYIILLKGQATFSINFNAYSCKGNTILFLAPYQLLQWEILNIEEVYFLQFHGDFYCIEYHKKEVSCNGILFNIPFDLPFVNLKQSIFEEILELFLKVKKEENLISSYDVSIAKSYLQLILALSSREKKTIVPLNKESLVLNDELYSFKILIENNFLLEKSVGFYANYFGMSNAIFSKRIKKLFGKAPSKLIQEKLVLEAKKQLHLTHKTIKEIADYLGFEDEFYFSRYFKKEVGISPKIFRDKVGISIVADISSL